MTELYEIRIRHRVGPELVHLLADLEPELGEDATILHTAGTDQPTLHGTLARLADLGLEIVSVELVATRD